MLGAGLTDVDDDKLAIGLLQVRDSHGQLRVAAFAKAALKLNQGRPQVDLIGVAALRALDLDGALIAPVRRRDDNAVVVLV